MSIEIVALTVVVLADALLGLLSQIFWWQRKEYRWDRIKVHLVGSEGAPRHYFLVLLAMVSAALGGLFGHSSAFALHFFPWLTLLAVLAHHLIRIRRQGMLRPDMTLKARLVFVVATVLIYLLLTIGIRILGEPDIFIIVAFLVAFLPLIVAAAVGLVNIPAWVRKQQIIRQAAFDRNKVHPAVVGITGSVGKTSTKFFLHQLLEQASRSVRSTKQHRNSEFTVAQDMLEQLTSDIDVYVAEMGAYRKNEIKLLAALAQPSVGVITAIGNQHIALFGSRESLLNAKWELIDALPKNGTAVLNADDQLLQQRAKSFTGTIIWYSIHKQVDVYMSDVTLGSTETTATLHIQDGSYPITLPLVSEGLLISFTAAAATAHALGVEASVIAEAASSMKSFSRTMEIRSGKNSSIVIDDSYSASEDAVCNAVKHLSQFPRSDKRVIMVPVIELGTEGSAVHTRLSKVLAASKARVFVYGDTFAEELSSAIPADQISWFADAKALASAATEGVSKDTVVLLEGRIPAVVRKSFFL